MKQVTVKQAKTIVGKAMCEVLGIPVKLTKAGHLSRETAKALNQAGYYWFPGRRVWDKLKWGE